MAGKGRERLERRGQPTANEAIAMVVEGRTLPGETVQQIADTLVDDSPYQVRQQVDTDSLDDLVQGMRVAGFQGVLIVRPHGDVAQRRRGRYELVYGHRRRAAWRRLCRERGEDPQLPVVVREISDQDMLTIGAQENLNREDLSPVEEALIVHWYERQFFPKSQAQIAAMLGKTEAWVALRARIHRLPGSLKDGLRRRPRAMHQFLEAARVHERDPAAAVALAERIVAEELTVQATKDAVQELLGGREETHKRTFERALVTEATDVDGADGFADDQHLAARRSASSEGALRGGQGSSRQDLLALRQQVDGDSETVLMILERWEQLRAARPDAQVLVDEALDAVLTRISLILGQADIGG